MKTKIHPEGATHYNKENNLYYKAYFEAECAREAAQVWDGGTWFNSSWTNIGVIDNLNNYFETLK
jgi:hypothetical protein